MTASTESIISKIKGDIGKIEAGRQNKISVKSPGRDFQCNIPETIKTGTCKEFNPTILTINRNTEQGKQQSNSNKEQQSKETNTDNSATTNSDNNNDSNTNGSKENGDTNRTEYRKERVGVQMEEEEDKEEEEEGEEEEVNGQKENRYQE
jgi:hypothetical protein